MAATESYVQVPPDATGKKVRALEMTVGANDVYMEGAVVYDSSGVTVWSNAGQGRQALRDVFAGGYNVSATHPVQVDVIDRAVRLLGIVYGESAQLQQLTPADSMAPGLALEVVSFLALYDSVAGDWNRAREGADVGSLLTDPADRAARLLGVVYGDVGQVHQVTPADGVSPGDALSSAAFNLIFNGATWDVVREGASAGSVLTDVTDRAARLLGVVYGDAAQLNQTTPADALTPANSLETSDFLHVYDSVAADWNRVREGTTVGSIVTEDTGLNTNPRRYEKDNGFVSAVVETVAPYVPIPMWAVGTGAINPAGGRTAGEDSTIYSFHMHNRSGGNASAWLEIGGVMCTVMYPLANNQALTVDWDAGLNTGNQDVDAVATTASMLCHVTGTEV